MTTYKRTDTSPSGPLSYAIAVIVVIALFSGCGDDSNDAPDEVTPAASIGSVTPTSAPGTPAPPDPEMARQAFLDFVDAVQDGDLEGAWGMYVASVPGDMSSYVAALGCQFEAFGGEFPRMQNMFERLAPFEVDEIFGAASGSRQVELKLTGNDGDQYLATLVREPPDSPYRLRFFNSGRVAQQPGVPDPFPSPEDPQGYCGIWTGPR